MALTECADCGGQSSTAATTSPHCGTPSAIRDANRSAVRRLKSPSVALLTALTLFVCPTLHGCRRWSHEDTVKATSSEALSICKQLLRDRLNVPASLVIKSQKSALVDGLYQVGIRYKADNALGVALSGFWGCKFRDGLELFVVSNNPGVTRDKMLSTIESLETEDGPLSDEEEVLAKMLWAQRRQQERMAGEN